MLLFFCLLFLFCFFVEIRVQIISVRASNISIRKGESCGNFIFWGRGEEVN